MFCLHHDGDAVGLETIHERLRDLGRQVFLNLQTARENIDNARHLREADDFPVRNVGNVGAADEREQMMLAHRVKLDVLNQNNLARVGIENRVVDDLFHALAIALGEKFHRPGRTCRRPCQSLTRRILSDGVEQIAVDFSQSSDLTRWQRLGQSREAVFSFNFGVVCSQDRQWF